MATDFEVGNSNVKEVIAASSNKAAVREFVRRHPEEALNALTVKPLPVKTYHAKAEGGRWDNPNTWEEHVIPPLGERCTIYVRGIVIDERGVWHVKSTESTK